MGRLGYSGRQHSRESFIALNAKIPLLETASETLAESNAILNRLADGTTDLPRDRWQRARVRQSQFFEPYSHEPYIAVARFIATYLGLSDHRRAEYEQKQTGGRKALAVMQTHRANRRLFVDDRPTIAGISRFAYTHVAGEGGFDLGDFPAVQAWITRIRSLPSHVPIG